ncbi:chaperone modulator CbpM [Imhoffiella purpurea]|uniref:Transcriptional regulator, MerR family n=1 Tax=Imhoffiella purpurea TaxID=1249627 RepID=W9V1Z0_9GAMM|nr:chaperone modulator CbpM [Imhoffiella purpurea]EXJ13309.1 transcriptional regulator, MerR family [Imhoffiella purpurea]
MSENHVIARVSGDLLEEDIELTLSELCRACRLPADRVLELVEEGVVDPLGRDPARWRFSAVSIRRVRCAQRLERDLGVNAAGAALALELLEEMERLRARLHSLQQ